MSNLKHNPIFFALTGGQLGWVDIEAVFDRDNDGYIQWKGACHPLPAWSGARPPDAVAARRLLLAEFVNGISLVLLLHHVKDTPEHRRQLATLMFTMLDFDRKGAVSVLDVCTWLRAARSLGIVDLSFVESKCVRPMYRVVAVTPP